MTTAADEHQVRAFAARTQPMSPDDRAALVDIVAAHGPAVAAWLPERIAVRENTALIFGTLLFAPVGADVPRGEGALVLLDVAQRHLTTATDVLRVIAVASGADASLAPKRVKLEARSDPRWSGKIADKLAAFEGADRTLAVSIESLRFAVVKLPRPVRRTLLALLEAIDEDALLEDMQRHRSAWVWVGELLHPREYAKRFPKCGRAFAAMRDPGLTIPTFASRVATAITARDVPAAVALLRARPGELARRLDHLLRLAGPHADLVLAAFAACAPRMTTPVLLGLRALAGTRRTVQPRRVFWPRGAVSTGFVAPETRPALSADIVDEVQRIAADVLLARFATLPALPAALLDAALADIVVPFTERTAARSTVALPRGSRVSIGNVPSPRVFLHWCEPSREEGGESTDIDLSVAFYTGAWEFQGACSFREKDWWYGAALHSGDILVAPPPDGATEHVDLDRAKLRERGSRFAVMTVNNFRGMAFSALARGFAGVLTDDIDPQAALLRFQLTGENGVYMPLVIDLDRGEFHWLDIYTKGELATNTVEGTERTIATVCPSLMGYFASGARPQMFDLAAMHAAARCRAVTVRERDGALVRLVRAPDESPRDFLARIAARRGYTPVTGLPDEPTFAALLRLDVRLPATGTTYALFGATDQTIAASDLLSV